MIDELYTQAVARQKEPKAGSYTNYLFDKGIDFIGGVGGGQIHHVAELGDGRFPQSRNNLHAKGLHGRKGGLAVLKPAEDLLIKMQLEFCVHLTESLIQHGAYPPVG